jgi:hypothetical protein
MKLRFPLYWIGTAGLAFATPSGLNNIPTADTTPQGTFVFQLFSTMGNDRDTDLNFGFKSGLDLGPVDFEFGTASHLVPDKSGPWSLHSKMAVPFGEGLPTVALGVVNVTFSEHDRDRGGEPFGYIVLSHDVGWFRVHGGCGMQDGEALPFFGMDKTFSLKEKIEAPPSGGKNPKAPAVAEERSRDLFTLRSDAIRQLDDSWLYSAGALIPLHKNFVLEAWGNFPDSGDEASLTLKANFVFKF